MRRKPRDEYARSDARTGSGVGEVAAPAITEGYSYQPYVLDTYSLPTDCRLKPAPLPEPIAAGDEWREQFWEAEAKVNRLIELCREQPALNSCLTVYQIYEAIGLANVHEISIKDHATTITALQSERDRLREALERTVKFNDVRIARAALAGKD
jgi:hypothetical protein